MLYRWLVPLSHHHELFNVFRYPSFRMVAAGLLSLLLGMLLGPWFIRGLAERQYGQSNIRADTPQQHQKKQGTPTMGGGLDRSSASCCLPSCWPTSRTAASGLR